MSSLELTSLEKKFLEKMKRKPCTYLDLKPLSPKYSDITDNLIKKGYVKVVRLPHGKRMRTFYYLSLSGWIALGGTPDGYEEYRSRLLSAHKYFALLAKDVYGDKVEISVVETRNGRRIPDLIHKFREGGIERRVHVEYERTNSFRTLKKHIIDSLSTGEADAVLIVVDTLDKLRLTRDKILEAEKDFSELEGYISITTVSNYLSGRITRWKQVKDLAVWKGEGLGNVVPVSLKVTNIEGGVKASMVVLDEKTGREHRWSFAIKLIYLKNGHRVKPEEATDVIGKIQCLQSSCGREFHVGRDSIDDACIHVKTLLRGVIDSGENVTSYLRKAISLKFSSLFPNSVRFRVFLPEDGGLVSVNSAEFMGSKVYFCDECLISNCQHTRMVSEGYA